MAEARSILLVDQNPEVARFLEALLTEYGYAVHPTARLTDAYRVMRAGRIDVGLVDAGALADGSGLDLVRSLRKRGNRLPLLFLSDRWLDDELYQELTRDLDVRLVRKPISANELLVQLQMVLGSLPDEGLLEVMTEELDREELDARRAARRIQVERARLEGALGTRLAELQTALDGTYDAPSVQVLLQQIRDASMTLGRASIARLADQGVQAVAAGEGPDAVLRTARSVVAAGMPQSDPNARARVLLLDEDPASAVHFGRVARELQLAIEVAPSLDGAAGLLHTAAVDAAVVHLGLRTIDPFHAARVLRSLAPSLPILFLGPEADVDARVSAVHAGGSFLLVDPVSAADLEAALLRIEAERATLQPQVLLVDAKGTFTSELSAALRPFSELSVLDEPRRLFEVLSERRPHALIVAGDLGGWSGFDVCRLVRGTSGWQHLPILLVLGDAPPEARIAAFEAGADDWIARPFLTEELIARIRARAERIRVMSDLSAVDALTGLKNRHGFVHAARERLAEAQRASRPVSICLLDVRGFDDINRERGHLAGERVLGGLGRTLAQRFRLGDVRGRWGGGEFVLCLLGIDRKTAAAIVARVAEEFAAHSFQTDDGSSFHAALATAIASYPEDGDTLDALVGAARSRMH
jgi:diguanylate cyclase (GGDEF)-like protein